jgi:hypothetical protein
VCWSQLQLEGTNLMNGIVKGRVVAAAVCAAIITFWQASASATVISSQVYNTNGHTYLLLESSSWPAAETEALGLGGHLVTVNDSAENAFIYSTFGPIALSHTLTGKVNLWLGYNDVASEGNFVWVSGQSSLYTDWFPDQPQDNQGDEDYVGIRVRGNTGAPVGHWIDIVSDGRLGDTNYGVVEVESTGPSAPEPSAFLLASLGTTIGFGGRFLRRRGRAGRAATN